jgi:hypothetical protein
MKFTVLLVPFQNLDLRPLVTGNGGKARLLEVATPRCQQENYDGTRNHDCSHHRKLDDRFPVDSTKDTEQITEKIHYPSQSDGTNASSRQNLKDKPYFIEVGTYS